MRHARFVLTSATLLALALAVGARADTDASAERSEPPPDISSSETVAIEGESPGYKDIRVSDRAPNMYGQTGLFRVTSAKVGEGGYFDLGLHGRYFYGDNFIIDQSTNQAGYGAISFGAAIFDYAELSATGLFAANENSRMTPHVTFTTGDFATSLKLAFPVSVVAFGVDTRLLFPAGRDKLGPELDNFNLQAQGLFTLDLWEELDVPLRAHLNAGYAYQNRGTDPERLFSTPTEQILALTFEYTYYDRVVYGLGIEAPLPYVTPFVELTGEYLLAPDAGFTDAPLRVTPGVRITPGRGLAFDLGADLRLLGGGRLIEGVATPPPWQVHAGLSYNFSPFVAETRVEIRELRGKVGGIVTDAESGEPVPDAVLEFEQVDGPRISANTDGRYRSYDLRPGPLRVTVSHPDYKPRTVDSAVQVDQTMPLDVALTPDPKYGTLKGVVVDEDDLNVPAILELVDERNKLETYQLPGGSYRLDLLPGSYQAVVKAEGYLQQGRAIKVERSQPTIEDFVLKPEPKQRVTILKTDSIEITSTIHFEFSKWRILAESYHILDEVVDIMLKHPEVKRVKVEGHTDAVGEAEYNQLLSDNRAQAVIDYLIEHGVEEERLESIGHGEDLPIATNETEEGRAQNRRVEFNIIERE